MFVAASCQYKFIVEPATDPTETIYFSKDILPIWNDGNNCTACHIAGTQRPNLTPDVAYSEITSMGLIDLANPEESEIYDHPNPENTGEHTWKKYTNAQAATVLAWIKQGALNN